MLSKQNLRKQMIQMRNQLSTTYREECSEKINKNLIADPFFEKTHTVLFYMAFRNEVDVSMAMQEAWKRGKRVVLPKANPQDHTMRCFEIEGFEECIVGAYGIREPLEQASREVKPTEIDLVIVPGVAFDRLGYRLGYGAGYYDRFFAQAPSSSIRVGVAYPEQIVETVYPEAHDVPMHHLITAEK